MRHRNFIKPWVAITATVVMAILSGSASARTWRVEKDGSGDFTVIQQALDAAAGGDSILIGPGRFDDIEKRPVSFGTLASSMFINNSDLTVVGVDSSQTVIGPALQTDLFQQSAIMTTIVDAGHTGTRFLRMTLEHNNSLVSLDEAASFEDCRFYYAKRSGVSGGGAVRMQSVDGVSFLNCSFYVQEGGQTAIVSFVGGQNPNLSVINCTFEQRVDQFCGCSTMTIEGADNLLVSGSTFVRGTTGILARNGRGIRITDCDFDGLENFAMLIEGDSPGSSEAVLRSSRIYNPGGASIQVGKHSEFLAEDCVFGGGSYSTLVFSGPVFATIRQSDILPGPAFSARVEVIVGIGFVDLRNNYWGSSDSTQIAGWILDENDHPCVGWWCPGIVAEFVPFLGQSTVPIESPSMGGLKGMYRSPK